MPRVRLASLLVGGAARPWEAIGMTVGGRGLIALANGAIELTGAGRPGISGWTLAGLDPVPEAAIEVDGLVTAAGIPVPLADHPNGAYEIDHVVVTTDSLERTSGAIAGVLGAELRRIRETDGGVRQGFHRLGPGGVIVEVVERPDAGGVRLWGVVFTVSDLDRAIADLGPDRIGPPKPAVQPGRRIATVRSGAGLGVPVALMSPEERV